MEKCTWQDADMDLAYVKARGQEVMPQTTVRICDSGFTL